MWCDTARRFIVMYRNDTIFYSQDAVVAHSAGALIDLFMPTPLSDVWLPFIFHLPSN